MAIILSHITAAQLFSTGSFPKKEPLLRGASSLDTFAGTPSNDADTIDALKKVLPAPIHILVPPDSGRKRTRTLVPHTYAGPVDACMLWRLTDSLLVSAPAWSFVQAAQTMRAMDLALYGYLLCGTHALANAPGALIQRPSLATSNDVKTFIARHPALKGIRLARSVAPRLNDGSASPMESALAMRFVLPRSQGGLGLERIVLNHRVDIAKRQQAIAQCSCFYLDIFLPDVSIGVEYDSDTFHTASEKIARDALRRNILESMGIRMLTVTRRQLLDAEEFRIVADNVYELMGKHYRKRSAAMRRREDDLACELRGALSRMRPTIPNGIVLP